MKLNDNPDMVRLVQNIIATNNQSLGAKLLKALERGYYQQLLNPDPFITMEEDLEGEFFIGQTQDGRRVGLDRQDLVRHTLIVGQSGVGKTNLMRLLFYQILGREF